MEEGMVHLKRSMMLILRLGWSMLVFREAFCPTSADRCNWGLGWARAYKTVAGHATTSLYDGGAGSLTPEQED